MKSGNGFRTACGMQIILSQPPRTASVQLRKQLKWMSLEKKGNGSDGSSSKLCNEESSTLYKEACRQLLRSGVGWHRVLTTSNSLCNDWLEPQVICIQGSARMEESSARDLDNSITY